MGIFIRQDKPRKRVVGASFLKSFSNLACALTHDDKIWEDVLFSPYLSEARCSKPKSFCTWEQHQGKVQRHNRQRP